MADHPNGQFICNSGIRKELHLPTFKEIIAFNFECFYACATYAKTLNETPMNIQRPFKELHLMTEYAYIMRINVFLQ